jgi:hypothetical protein
LVPCHTGDIQHCRPPISQVACIPTRSGGRSVRRDGTVFAHHFFGGQLRLHPPHRLPMLPGLKHAAVWVWASSMISSRPAPQLDARGPAPGVDGGPPVPGLGAVLLRLAV